MSRIKKPNDSLQTYFDELLFESAADVPLIIVSKKTALKTPNETVKKTKKREPQPRGAAQFADPTIEQKQKLQKLLHSVQPKMEVVDVVKPQIAVATKVTNQFLSDPNEIQEWQLETGLSLTAEVIAEQQILQHQYQIPGLEWLPNGLPQWAQARFDVLLFKVSGLTLAVPLITLGHIQPLTDELTPLFGQADWFMGLLPTTNGNILTVNTAKFVMPERYDENFVKSAKYVVSISGVPWGLAVDSINQPIRLDIDAVNWRTNRSKRPWLAGTIKEHMCVLLDIPMIGQMLLDADKNHLKNNH